MPLSVALFVEGSGGNVPSKQEHGALARIWSEILPTALGCTSRPRIVPMSKRSLVALALPGPLRGVDGPNRPGRTGASASAQAR